MCSTLGFEFIEVTEWQISEINATEEIYYVQFPSGGDMPHRAGPWGSMRFGQETEGVRGKPEPSLCFPRERKVGERKPLGTG